MLDAYTHLFYAKKKRCMAGSYSNLMFDYTRNAHCWLLLIGLDWFLFFLVVTIY
jgi:hypothetical protein